MKFRIGVIGSGFIAKNFYEICKKSNEFKISKLLTRTNIKKRTDINNSILTNNLDYILKNSDLIFDCTGDAIYSTDIISEIINNKLPVVTMNSEFHATIGNYFNDKGLITESDGDQPGSLAKLNENICNIGFNPIIYGIHKGFLNYKPSIKNMSYWSNKNGLTENKTIAFTDGSKVEIESIFIANSFDCYISKTNRKNIKNSTEKRIENLYKESLISNKKYVDFFVGKNSPPGVFIVADHIKNQKDVLRYLKLGNSYFTLEKPYHLCHMEVLPTIKEVISNKKLLLNSKINRYMPATITKCNLKEGTKIQNALGSYQFRCVSELRNDKLVPITLLKNATLKKNINEGHLLTFDDVELEKTKALSIWKNLK